MKRSIIGGLCLALLCAMTAPAFALETKLSGFYKLRAIGDNFSARNNFIGTLKDNNKSEAVFDQRLRMKLDSKINEYVSFTYYAEVDMQFGDEQYSNAGRNDGGGLGGDTTNLETKNLYVDIKVPDTSSAFRLGLQGFDDNYDYAFFGADMAGIKYNTSLDGADLTAAYFNLGNGGAFEQSTNINLWALQTSFKPSENFKYGVDYYYYQNQGANVNAADPTLRDQHYASFFGTADIDAVLAFNTGSASWTGQRDKMDLHYLGGRTEYRLDNLVLSGWVNVNVGTVDNINNNDINKQLTEDLDVQGFAARIKAQTAIGGIKLAASGTFFSGDDDLSDGDADFVVNPLATESFAFATDGFMIMTPDINWNSIGQYGFAMVDAAWAGYGLAAVNLTGSLKPTDNTYIKSGIGYFASLEDKLAAADPRTDRKGTTLGTEVFLRAGYKMSKNLDLSINGAYAWLGDFYDNNGGGTNVNAAATDIDDPFEVYAQVTVSF